MKGVYLLVIYVKKETKIEVGSLGKIDFKKGFYAYVGSAQNNLEKRIARHLKKNKKKFWHIDYLVGSKFANVLKTLYIEGKRSLECEIAGELIRTQRYIPDFGSSDCNCKSHLFIF